MAINNYIRPSLEVHQQLEVTVNSTGDHLAACVVGANYDLHRYGYEENLPSAAYGMNDGSQDFTITYGRNPAYNYILDENSLKLYAKDLHAVFGTSGEGATVDTKDIFVVRAPSDKYFAGTGVSADAKFIADYSVEAGDRVRLTYGTGDDVTTVDAIVMDLIGTPVDPKFENPASVTGVTGVTVAFTDEDLTSKKDTYYYIKVFSKDQANPDKCTLEVFDSAGTMPTRVIGDVPLAQSYEVTVIPGIKVTATWGDAVAVGATITIPFTAASIDTTKLGGLKLNKPATLVSEWTEAGDTAVAIASITVYKTYTGPIEGIAFAVTEDTVDKEYTVAATGYPSFQENGDSVAFADSEGTLYLEYRMLLSPLNETEDLYEITSLEDIQTYFGTIAQENDIAYACACALKGSAGRPVFALRVVDQTAPAYRKALDKVERNGSLYSFAILNMDSAVRQTVMDYVVARSQPDMKKWCRAIFGADNPGAYIIARQTTEGKQIIASAAPYADSSYPDAQILQLSEEAAAGLNLLELSLGGGGITASMYPGDMVQLVSTGTLYPIAAVTGPNTLILEKGPVGGFANDPIVLWKADTAKNFADYTAAVAEEVGSRRGTVVWCDKGTYTEKIDGEIISRVVANKYLAAEVAGIASAVVPQAPITRTEVQSIQAATRMYTKYTQNALDDIAKNGVMIITQDEKNSPCYIRHQLTTETDKGSLYYEESCTRNLDNISYAVATQLESFVGKSNVTPSALRRITVAMVSILNRFTNDSPSDLIGPSLIKWDELSVAQDPVFLDRVIVKVRLYLPLPLNNIKVYEMAYAAEVVV